MWRHVRLGRLATTMSGVVILAGCTGGGADFGVASGHDLGPATLTVHIGLYGGPLRPDGRMALSNSPAANENVTAVDAEGRRSTAPTDADGVVTMRLAPGRYTVFSTYCGTGPHHVVLTADRSARVQIDCPIP